MSVDTRGPLELGTQLMLFVSYVASTNGRQYAVSRDGKRFLTNMQTQQASIDPLTVTINGI